MKNLTALRNQIAITICLFTIISTGCTTVYQKVNADLLEQNRGKTFKLGIVKAAGNKGVFRLLSNDILWLIPSSTYFECIKTAVDNIPTAEICSLLSSQYSITIDANVDKTIRVREEEKVEEHYIQKRDKSWGFEKQKITTFTAEYGKGINTKEFPDVVNVTYSFDMTDMPRFYYDIDIISSGQKIVTLHGIVGKKFFGDLDSYVYYAGRISEALKRDLSEASKADLSETVEATNAVPTNGSPVGSR